MKFTIKRETILPLLQITNAVVERRHTLPILSNLLISLDKNTINVTGTDMEVEIIASHEANSGETSEFTVPGRKLLDICRALPEAAQLDFSIEKDHLVLKTGKSRFTLAMLAAKDFPQTEIASPLVDFEIEQGVFKSLMEDTMFAMAQQDVRYYLNGLLLELNGKTLRAVATDGHRLAMKEIDQSVDISEPVQIIIPRKGVIELVRLLEHSEDKARIQITRNHIRANLNGIQFTSKLIDGKFPDYERVLPKETSTPLKADKNALKQSLTRASILSNEKYKGVRIILKNNSLQALAHNPEQEEAEEELEVDYQGPEMEIGFNVTYLLDAINAVRTDSVLIATNDSESSCLILPDKETGCRYVVMPMRL
jgi:DNA polymerase-3 subunit beta